MAGTNSRVFVTGAGGFIGGHVSRWFAERGVTVFGHDRHAPQERSPFARFHCATLPHRRLGKWLAAAQPDLLIHAAGPALIQESIADPAADFEASVTVFFSVLDAVRHNAPGCRVLLLSSAAVVGSPKYLPVSEDAPTTPLSPYGYHKLMCEWLAREFHTVYGVQSTIARIFSAYGPGLRRQVMWDISRKVLAASQVELYGTGEETRDFIYIDDLCRAIELMGERASFQAEIYNVASGVETTIRRAAELIVRHLGREVSLNFNGQRRPGDPTHWHANISRLKQIGFTPNTSIEDGTRQVALWAAEQL